MNQVDYLKLIESKYPKENARDVFMMMTILAGARAELRGEELTTSADFDFAGTILCVIFDPIKFTVTNYADNTKSLRRAYRDIASSTSLQDTFRESLKPELLSAENASEAIKVGVDNLFLLPATFEED